MTLELGLGNQSLFAPLALQPAIPTMGTIFKDAPLRGQCVLETILNGMHDRILLRPSYKMLRCWLANVEISSSPHLAATRNKPRR